MIFNMGSKLLPRLLGCVVLNACGLPLPLLYTGHTYTMLAGDTCLILLWVHPYMSSADVFYFHNQPFIFKKDPAANAYTHALLNHTSPRPYVFLCKHRIFSSIRAHVYVNVHSPNVVNTLGHPNRIL